MVLKSAANSGSHLSKTCSVVPQAEQDVRGVMGSLSLNGIFVDVITEVDLSRALDSFLLDSR